MTGWREMSRAFSLADRHAVVVGAAGGIGAATARLFAGLGATLTIADRERPSDLADELASSVVAAHACDVASRPACEALIADGPAPDVLVVTAALCPWDDWEEDGWDETFRAVIDVNLKGALDLVRASMARMRGRGGRIVLVTSLAGRTGGLIASPHYVASKGGLVALVKWLSRQGAPDGILVNGVAPASVKTPMMEGRPVDLSRIPLHRMATADEVAGPIAFLCVPASSYMTGTILDVNGGVFAA